MDQETKDAFEALQASIENLAQLTAKGFSEAARERARIEQKLENRFELLERMMFTNREADREKIGERIAKLEKRVSELEPAA